MCLDEHNPGEDTHGLSRATVRHSEPYEVATILGSEWFNPRNACLLLYAFVELWQLKVTVPPPMSRH